MSKTMNNPMSFHDKYTHLCSDIGNVTTFLHLIIESHKEVIDKSKSIKAISIGSWIRELTKINKAISLADNQIHQMLNYTGSKAYVNYTKQSNLADLKDKIQNHEFLSQTHNI